MSAGKGKGKKAKRGAQKASETERGKTSWVSWALVGLAVTVAMAGIFLLVRGQHAGSKDSQPAAGSASGHRTPSRAAQRVHFETLLGKWIRPDGGYILSVKRVYPDGRVDAGYFNPRPINVSQAHASQEGSTVKLFVELQAPGYPGSTYDLVYDTSNDALVGIYFQAAMQQRFQVIFQRTK
jgi:hypothetical protein